MSNPTTPFSWQMPTATDLVTDLPADFEVFGQAVATSMADLLGGSSGYILSKASATDMDFTWIANDQGDITGVTAGTGISGGGTSGTVTVTNSMATAITTNGDIIYGTGSGTFSRLGIGSSAQVLTVASGVPSWATPSSGSTFSGARVTKSASQSLANVTFTTITFDQEPLDVGGYHDSGNNTRLTVPSGKTGYFLVQWNLHAYNVTAMAYKLLKNGTVIAQFSDSYNWTTGTEVDFTNQWLGALSAADYVEIQGWQTSGSAKNVYGATGTSEPTWFQITYLGGA